MGWTSEVVVVLVGSACVSHGSLFVAVWFDIHGFQRCIATICSNMYIFEVLNNMQSRVNTYIMRLNISQCSGSLCTKQCSCTQIKSMLAMFSYICSFLQECYHAFSNIILCMFLTLHDIYTVSSMLILFCFLVEYVHMCAHNNKVIFLFCMYFTKIFYYSEFIHEDVRYFEWYIS